MPHRTTGSFTEGIYRCKKPFQNTTGANMEIYAALQHPSTDSSGKTAANTVVLFIGGQMRTTLPLYRPFLYKLAH